MRGRRPDAVSQEAKGNPGKRRKKASIADRIARLAEAPSAAGPLAPPAIFGLEEFAGAIQIWHEIVPLLDQRNMVDRLDRHTLAMYCYYLDRFWSAVAEIAEHGETQRVKTVAGGYMNRNNPAVGRRDDAFGFVMSMSKAYGFTPLDRNKLIREMAGAGAPIGGLFGGDRDGEGAGSGNGATPNQAIDDGDEDIVGFGRRLGGPAPGQRPN